MSPHTGPGHRTWLFSTLGNLLDSADEVFAPCPNGAGLRHIRHDEPGR